MAPNGHSKSSGGTVIVPSFRVFFSCNFLMRSAAGASNAGLDGLGSNVVATDFFSAEDGRRGSVHYISLSEVS